MFQKDDKKKEEEMIQSNENAELSLDNAGTEEEQILDRGTEKPEQPEQLEEQKIKNKLSEVENQYLRLLADYQNLQKRTASEKEELYRFAAQKTIEVLLPAMDTFDYARQSVKPDSKVEKIVEDFNLVFEMLLKCLKDIGLEPIEETGILFNPLYHEPLHQIPTNELPDHTVMQVLKKGYVLNKKVIRPALVTVSIKQEKTNIEGQGNAG